jgi:outer membrane protein OmpA-like peptidoglycan-associated protein
MREIHLIGHTDERGSDDFNLKLSIERAKTLKNYLENERISASLVTSGQGEREPMQLNNPENYTQEEIYALNRRVEVIVKNLQGFQNLEGF